MTAFPLIAFKIFPLSAVYHHLHTNLPGLPSVEHHEPEYRSMLTNGVLSNPNTGTE